MPPAPRLDNNKLSGTLPGGDWLPTALTLLSLHHNQLSGALPEKLDLPPKLTQISLHWNALTGSESPRPAGWLAAWVADFAATAGCV